jgi:Anti-sigma-K factor rskA
MDIQSFIQSGLLESYALEQCTPEERILVEEMLLQYPEARTELAAIEQALEQYARAQSVAPPGGLKEQIMQEIDRVRTVDTRKPGNNNNMLRLFQLITLGLLAATIYLWFQRTQLETNQGNLQQQVAQLQLERIDCDARNASCREIVNLLRNPQTQSVKMSNPNVAPAFVFHNTSATQCTALLDVAALPAQQTGKFLQFWALVDGKPVSMGMIQQDTASGFQSFPCVANAAGFAVSVEDNPNGNAAPTFVLIIGTVG